MTIRSETESPTAEERERAQRICLGPANNEGHHPGDPDCICERAIIELRAHEKAAREKCARCLDQEVREHKRVAAENKLLHKGRLFNHSASWLKIMARHLRDPVVCDQWLRRE
jgi:hypothetical protein